MRFIITTPSEEDAFEPFPDEVFFFSTYQIMIESELLCAMCYTWQTRGLF